MINLFWNQLSKGQKSVQFHYSQDANSRKTMDTIHYYLTSLVKMPSFPLISKERLYIFME